jgi:hypothetical protein
MLSPLLTASSRCGVEPQEYAYVPFSAATNRGISQAKAALRAAVPHRQTSQPHGSHPYHGSERTIASPLSFRLFSHVYMPTICRGSAGGKWGGRVSQVRVGQEAQTLGRCVGGANPRDHPRAHGTAACVIWPPAQ